MPTTRTKNLIYRMILPFNAPRLNGQTEINVLGRPLNNQKKYMHLLKKHHVLGSAALLAQGDNRSILTCSMLNPERRVFPHSLFRVASITKMATALAALSAVEEGYLNLNEPVNSAFSIYAGIHPVSELENVTLFQLLSHTSGITDPENMEEALIAGIPFQKIIKGCRPNGSKTLFRYSNFGYGLIGCLLEAVYQIPISDILKQKVFHPLGMQAFLDASQINADEIVPISRVLPYRPEKSMIITPLGKIPLREADPIRHYGHTAGSMYVDIMSLEKLIRCLISEGKPILGRETGKRMSEQIAFYGKSSPTLSYGLGLLIVQDPSISSHRILGHQGFAYGCADGAFWEEKTGRIVIFLNGGASEARHGRLGICNEEILRWALKKEMPKWSESVR